MTKVSKESVNYRRAGRFSRVRCATCSMFRELIVGVGGCTLVRGLIAGSDVCNDYDPRKVTQT